LLRRYLIDVQLHTHRHRMPRAHGAFTREIVDNRRRISALADGAALPRHFCYPSGAYAAVFLDWLRAQGIESATTCIPGLAARGSEPLLIPRLLDTMVTSDLTFEAWASGFAALLPLRSKYGLNSPEA
jgi:peptidoglycan/xylan/chitin deacetylase (PgdA/CDA1 family)